MTEEKMREIRGKQISMVFQDPMTSLDPLMSIGDQITETITTHEKIPKREAEEKALSLLEAVGISGDRFKDFPGYRARIRNHGHSCFLCEIVIRSQFHTTYEPEA
jgi:ABC-type dipeptide/oligopeptide/nickel transport system, ATPase component